MKNLLPRIIDRPGFSHMILRCPDGHEWVWRFQLLVPLTDFCWRARKADKCVECGKKKCVVLTSDEYSRAAERLAGIYAEDVS